ncbi:hypothetical protein [Ensifer sp.]|jgi:hypothetical protein|uniref:hypothetical protein n=1 Tax=Ensifer sp. TaxID=1872086 RepID=UPI002E1634BE|nr:hypothetical protein [Ensifer sp.]
MNSSTDAERVRAVIHRISASKMKPDPDDARRPLAEGGSWFSLDKEACLYLSFAKILLLRDAPPHAPRWKPWLHAGSIRLGGVFIEFCVWRWIEEIAPSGSSWWPFRSAGTASIRLHLAIEQINFSGAYHPGVAELSDEDMEKVAELIRVPMTQYLKKWIAYDRRIQAPYGRSVTGSLHENWRRPRPLLAELHEHLARHTRGFSWARISDPRLERYQLDEDHGGKIVRVDGGTGCSSRHA